MKKIASFVLVLLCLVLFGGSDFRAKLYEAFFPKVKVPVSTTAGDGVLEDAFRQGRSGFMVEVDAPVISILRDDNEGSRHQRFIVKLASGQTLLIVHNIDLAPRVAGLQVGSHVSAYGEYIWNEKGGLLHKTHINRGRNDPDGWIRHQGTLYQ
jgi:hypothetical protein